MGFMKFRAQANRFLKPRCGILDLTERLMHESALELVGGIPSVDLQCPLERSERGIVVLRHGMRHAKQVMSVG